MKFVLETGKNSLYTWEGYRQKKNPTLGRVAVKPLDKNMVYIFLY